MLQLYTTTLLYRSLYTNERLALHIVIPQLNNSIFDYSDIQSVEVFLHEKKSPSTLSDIIVPNATMDFLPETKSFDKRLF